MDENKVKEWVAQPDVCRCCLSTSGTCDMTTSYTSIGGIKEVFSDMLQECYGLSLSGMAEEGTSHLICVACLARLRDACSFRKQVQEAEQHFVEYINKDLKNRIDMALNTDIKMELDADPPDLMDFFESGGKVTRSRKLKSENKAPKVKSPKSLPRKRQRTKKPKCKKEKDADARPAATVPKKEEEEDSKPKIKKEIKTEKDMPNKTLRDLNVRRLRMNITLLLMNSTVVPFRYLKVNSSKYTCQYCDDSYFQIEHLKSHVHEKHANVTETEIMKSLKCMCVDFVKAEITEIRCKICEELFQNLESLTEHFVETHKKLYYHLDIKPSYGILGFILINTENLRCHLCNEEFKYFRTLVTHMSGHGDNFQCDLCKKKFFSKKLLTGHLRTHKAIVHKCRFCDKVFDTTSQKSHHMKKDHDYGKLKCPECGETFIQAQQRTDHLVKVHNYQKRMYFCNICSKEYATSGSYRKHMQYTHWKDKNYICETCGKNFTSQCVLKSHIRVHTGEKPYECKFCYKKFAARNTLRFHVRGHLNDKRYVCELCGAAFIQNNSLKGHYRVHHPESGMGSYKTKAKKKDNLQALSTVPFGLPAALPTVLPANHHMSPFAMHHAQFVAHHTGISGMPVHSGPPPVSPANHSVPSSAALPAA